MSDFIIRNFQSIEEAKIPVNGFTIIVGDSSAGKSACFRAIYAATHNRFKIGQVRYGEDHAEIKIRYSEDPSKIMVVRRSNSGSPIIKLGDQVFSKLARSVPKEVEEFNNFGSLDVGGDGYSLNFHEQFQKPLLLEYSQKKVMEILSASSSIDELNDVWYKLSSKREQNRGAFRTVEALVNENNAKISMLKYDYTQMEPMIQRMNSLYQECQDIDNQHDQAAEIYNNLQDMNVICKRQELLLQIQSIADNMGELNLDITDFNKLLNLLKTLSLISSRISLVESTQILASDEVFEKVPSFKELQYNISVFEGYTKKELLLMGVEDTYKQSQYLKTVVEKAESLNNSLSSLQLLDNRISVLVDIVDKHICPVCGSKVYEEL